ncbi:hypothetical protein EIP91_008931 [Steccherinum ochraceum]|uniref:WW domain-containing protein n=1 Tax=Steccherinum ochraceum TaxID=92696 RepID=A0A4R0RRL8_9APHY|nr:hypothetical protein EIP91_008931 [Steccherinum ochraceum]
MDSSEPPPYEGSPLVDVQELTEHAAIEVDACEQTSPEVTLVATTADRNVRYDRPATAILSPFDIPSVWCRVAPSACESPDTFEIPEGWVGHTHPEGCPYYVQPELKVITDANIQDPSIYAKLCGAFYALSEHLVNAQPSLPQDYEIYIYVDEHSDTGRYYLIDYEKRAEFWLRTCTTEELGIPEASSRTNLAHLLQSHFWNHVEFFPHRPVPASLVKELLAILCHARSDHLTSNDSTYPWTAEKYDEHIQILTAAKDFDNPWMTCFIGRAWARIEISRFDHYYGEPYARITRFQKRLPVVEQAHEAELESLVPDGCTYLLSWKEFVAERLTHWEHTSWKAVGLLIANACLLILSRTKWSTSCGLAAATVSTTTLFSGQALVYNHVDMDKVSVHDAIAYLRHIRGKTYGYTPAAMISCLPKALLAWSIIFTAVNMLGIVLEHIDSTFALIGFVGILIVLSLAILFFQHYRSFGSLFSCGRREDDVADLV